MPGGIDGVEYSKDVTNLNDKETSSKPPHPHNPKECDCSSIYEHTSLITSKVYEVNARVAAHSAGFAASAAYKVESDLMAVKAEYNIAKLEAQKAKLEAQKANDRVDSVLETLQSLERDTEATTEEAIEADNAAMASRNAADKAAAAEKELDAALYGNEEMRMRGPAQPDPDLEEIQERITFNQTVAKDSSTTASICAGDAGEIAGYDTEDDGKLGLYLHQSSLPDRIQLLRHEHFLGLKNDGNAWSLYTKSEGGLNEIKSLFSESEDTTN